MRTAVVAGLVALAVSAIMCHSLAHLASLLVQTLTPLHVRLCSVSFISRVLSDMHSSPRLQASATRFNPTTKGD